MALNMSAFTTVKEKPKTKLNMSAFGIGQTIIPTKKQTRGDEILKLQNEMIKSGQITNKSVLVPQKKSLIQKFGEYVLPKEKVRPIDVVREFPEALGQV